MIEYITGLMSRARAAQKEIEFFSQEKVDHMCELIAWATIQDPFARNLAELAVEETRMGDVESKYAKLMNKIRAGWFDLKGKKSTGIIEEDTALGLVKMAKPVGVIGALIPCTNCEATQVLKATNALKSRNAIIMAPHPRGIKTNEMVVNEMRKALESNGYPADLIIAMDKVSMDNSQELMKQCDLILATGGAGLVTAAYSSGTPAYGVGAGNAVSIVDETQDMAVVADKIRRSKTFDQATSCSTENSVLVKKEIYSNFIKAMEAEGGYLISADEKPKLQAAMWVDDHLNPKIVAQPAAKIAGMAGIELPEGTKFMMVEETGIGADYPFSGEKLSVVAAIYQWEDFDAAIEMVNDITNYSGAGHSCGIHTSNRDRILKLAERVKVSRVIVNQPQCLANSGAWINGMPTTLTLGCGTWGGNISSENVTWKHLMNTTWVTSPIPNRQPTDEELFSSAVRSGQ
jgi:sulfoacetaldehyde dehydrogenase